MRVRRTLRDHGDAVTIDSQRDGGRPDQRDSHRGRRDEVDCSQQHEEHCCEEGGHEATQTARPTRWSKVAS